MFHVPDPTFIAIHVPGSVRDPALLLLFMFQYEFIPQNMLMNIWEYFYKGSSVQEIEPLAPTVRCLVENYCAIPLPRPFKLVYI